MIFVVNSSDKPVTRAGIEFTPGETEFSDSALSAAQLAQIDEHAALNWQQRKAKARKQEAE